MVSPLASFGFLGEGELSFSPFLALLAFRSDFSSLQKLDLSF